MSKPTRRFDICAGRPYTTRDGEDKKQWINVGRMTEWDDGNFSIELHAVPVGSWFDGKLSAFEPKPRDESQGRTQRPAPTRQQTRSESPPAKGNDFGDDFDDQNIPF